MPQQTDKLDKIEEKPVKQEEKQLSFILSLVIMLLFIFISAGVLYYFWATVVMSVCLVKPLSYWHSVFSLITLRIIFFSKIIPDKVVNYNFFNGEQK